MDETKRQFATAISALLETMGQEATEARLNGYWLGLGDLELSQVEAAVAVAIRTNKRLASPAEIRELATVGNIEARSISAWGDVQRAFPIGHYKHVDFEDQIINAVIRSLGGWPAIFERCNNAENEKWYRIEFLKTYRAYVTSGVNGDACRPLEGLSECSDGIKPPIPRRIRCDASRRHRIQHSRRDSFTTQLAADLASRIRLTDEVACE